MVRYGMYTPFKPVLGTDAYKPHRTSDDRPVPSTPFPAAEPAVAHGRAGELLVMPDEDNDHKMWYTTEN
ncbi:MAG: hypothetical protein GY749_07325 [Desulfobacteraceae bacterium]|nr:hypothetical protein [Desulfobacteraceae bacterium]